MKLEKEPVNLWTFRVIDGEGVAHYTRPGELEDVEDFVREKRLDGQMCLCVIMPDVEVRFEANIDWSKSQFVKSIARTNGPQSNFESGGSASQPKKRGRSRGSVRKSVEGSSGNAADDLPGGAAEALGVSG
jgi:hypothetical protein